MSSVHFGDQYSEPGDFNVLVVEPRLSDHELRQSIIQFGRKGKPVWVSCFGYDDDPRELWEVPEVVTLFKRMIDMGMLSIMWPNVPGAEDYDPHPLGLGALQLWAIATGQMKKGGCHPDLQEFLRVLKESNKKCEALIRGEISEGQHQGSMRPPRE